MRNFVLFLTLFLAGNINAAYIDNFPSYVKEYDIENAYDVIIYQMFIKYGAQFIYDHDNDDIRIEVTDYSMLKDLDTKLERLFDDNQDYLEPKDHDLFMSSFNRVLKKFGISYLQISERANTNDIIYALYFFVYMHIHDAKSGFDFNIDHVLIDHVLEEMKKDGITEGVFYQMRDRYFTTGNNNKLTIKKEYEKVLRFLIKHIS